MRKSYFIYHLAILSILLLYCFTNTFAQQSETWSYQYYNSSHGLPSSEITALAKDSKGFLWVGTSSGVSVYDGYNFHNYSYTNTNELIGHVNTIKQGAGNSLWIGSDAGLFWYTENKMIKVSAVSSLPQAVNDILLTENNIMWLATENGPVKIDTKKIDFAGVKKITLTDHILQQWNSVTAEHRCSLIAKAPDNTIYIAQYANLFRLINDKPELIHSTTDSRDKILTLFPVSESKIYFDAAASEMNAVDNGTIAAHNPDDLYQPNNNNATGTWYVGTRGAYYFHAATGTVSQSIHYSDKYLLSAAAILKDSNFVWLASPDGLVKLKPAVFASYDLSAPSLFNDYYAVTELKNGRLLLGSNRGRILEKKGNLFVTKKDRLVHNAEIKALYEDEKGLWVATGYQGLVLLQNGNTKHFTTDNGLHDNTLLCFVKKKNGQLYVLGDRGMSEIIIGSDNSISFKRSFYQPNTTAYAKCFAAIESPGGNIWIANEEGLLYFKNDSLQKFILNDKQLHVNFLIKDKEDKVWIATAGDGILQCAFNKKDELEIIKQYTEADGLNSTHYLTLLTDKENNIWAGSSKGLSVIGQKGQYKNRILNFDESDGFIKAGYSYIRLYQDSNDTIWAATTFGFISFDPGKLLSADVAPVVYITGINEIKRNGVIVEKKLFQLPDKDEFSYSQNSFSFLFTALDYANQENVRYYYKLDGLDSNWISAGTLRSISFENLSPAKYSFRVKALNSKGIWSKEDAVYTFSIIPPFWKTWWFAVLLIAVMTTTFYFYIKRRERIIREKEKQNTEIQALKASNYQYQFEMNQVINYFANSIHQQTTIDDLLWDVAKNCIAKLGFEDCVIYLKNKERNVLVQKAAWGPKTSDENRIVNPIEILPGSGIVGAVALTGKAEIINDTSKDKRYIVDDASRLSEITIPIISNGQVTGIIDSEHPQKNFYTERHLQILTTIASLCADKIDKIKAEQQTREKEMELLKLNKDLATSQLTALRAQMNPHFIFNALNSVQQYILQGNVIEANKYLSKFSKLQREILNNSNQNFILLQKEMEMLNLYLELEQLRFAEKFSYTITKDETIDEEEIKIPPMIIQPFIENAIWHGLMPKTGDRFVKVNFSLPEEDQLVCTIIDNGIGREAAARLRQANNNDTQHKSKGLSLVYDRLNILQAQYGKPFTAAITDLTNEDGTSNGTKVTLVIYLDF